MAQVITITDRDVDADFGEAVAQAAQLEFQQATSAENAAKLIGKRQDVIVLWDVDHPGALEPRHPLSFLTVGQMLARSARPDRVFVLTDEPLNTLPHVFNIPAFGHHIYRRKGEAGVELCARLTQTCLSADPFGLEQFMPPGSASKKIQLRKASERRTATDAIQAIFAQKGLPPRVVSLASQAADELLMNAIFDAPVTRDGAYYRKSVVRSEDFALASNENVVMELALGPHFAAVSVTDAFGSLKQEAALAFLRKDYQTRDYRAKVEDQGAGLGIYGILQTGLSLLYICKPQVKTQAVIFIPLIKTFKDFKGAFRLFSLIFR